MTSLFFLVELNPVETSGDNMGHVVICVSLFIKVGVRPGVPTCSPAPLGIIEVRPDNSPSPQNLQPRASQGWRYGL